MPLTHSDLRGQSLLAGCGECLGSGWVHSLSDTYGYQIERCDTCKRLDDDNQAAAKHAEECGCCWGYDDAPAEPRAPIDSTTPEALIAGARAHEEQSEPGMGMGDLEAVLRAVWPRLNPLEQESVYTLFSETVQWATDANDSTTQDQPTEGNAP